MLEEKKFSRATIERLPLYYRVLQKFEAEKIKEISSFDFAKILGFKPVQVRKDLVEFGHFGLKGVGYKVHALKNKIANVLGLQNNFRLAIIGVGKMGAALANYEKISEMGFVVAALFDIDKKHIGEEINGVRIYDFDKFVPISHRKLIDIGVITVPDEEAQKVADVLAEAKIRGIWNFTSVKLKVPYFVTVVNEDLTIGLSTLSFYVNQSFENVIKILQPL